MWEPCKILFIIQSIHDQYTSLCVLTNWHAKSILINGLQNPAKACEGRSPHGMLQIVTSPIKGAVLSMKAHVRAVGVWTMHHTSWQVGHQLQVWWRQQILVWKVCSGQNISTQRLFDNRIVLWIYRSISEVCTRFIIELNVVHNTIITWKNVKFCEVTNDTVLWFADVRCL